MAKTIDGHTPLIFQHKLDDRGNLCDGAECLNCGGFVAWLEFKEGQATPEACPLCEMTAEEFWESTDDSPSPPAEEEDKGGVIIIITPGPVQHDPDCACSVGEGWKVEHHFHSDVEGGE
jgi:hypothetical protein